MTDNGRITRRTLLGIGAAAAVGNPLRAFVGPAQTSPKSPVNVEKDVVVGKDGGVELRCDVYRPPAGTEKRMALLHLHGGGFARGSKDTLGPKLAPIMARGYLSVALEYRLSGMAKWPAQLEDIKTAIRWMRANADSLAIDTKRIATVGYSAGGHLALFAAGAADMQLAACVAFYPVVELSKENVLALLPPGSDDAAVRAASPITYVLRRAANTYCRSFAEQESLQSCTHLRVFRTNLTHIPNLPRHAHL
jgi:acetyl esterase/lipase